VILALLALPACSERRSNGCSENSDCAAGQVCDSGDCYTVCSHDAHCHAGQVCSAGRCTAGTRSAPVITGVDSDGPADGAPDHAPHHLGGVLRITGENLEGSAVRLGSPAGIEELELCATTVGELVAALPAALVPGTYELSVTNQGGSCGVQVPLLQGVPGDEGPAGAAGPMGPMPVVSTDAGLIGIGSSASPLAVDLGRVAATLHSGRFFEAEGPPLSTTAVVGGTAAAGDASAGGVRFAAAATATGGRVWAVQASELGGPLSQTPATTSVRVRVTSTLSTSPLASFGCAAIRASTSTWSDAATRAQIVPSLLPQSGGWLELRLVCDFRPDDVDQLLVVEEFVVGVTDLSIDWARIDPMTLPRRYAFSSQSNGGDFAISTAHSDNTDINFECPIVTGGGALKVEYCLGFQISGGSYGGTYVRLWLDGAAYASPGYWDYSNPNDNVHSNNCGMWLIPAVAPGRHVVELRPYLHACNTSCTYHIRNSTLLVEEL
jgi:Cys-rich repeat protein